MSSSWWNTTSGPLLAQGDMLPGCQVPVFVHDLSVGGVVEEIELVTSRLIIISQSCDLQLAKLEFVALCPIHTLPEFEASNPKFARASEWENVRKGRHLVASPLQPDNNRESFVVDFGQIVSLPFNYLSSHAAMLGDRWRLTSPYLEHFSQAFARFFMRVGLPSSIPPYK